MNAGFAPVIVICQLQLSKQKVYRKHSDAIMIPESIAAINKGSMGIWKSKEIHDYESKLLFGCPEILKQKFFEQKW